MVNREFCEGIIFRTDLRKWVRDGWVMRLHRTDCPIVCFEVSFEFVKDEGRSAEIEPHLTPTISSFCSKRIIFSMLGEGR